VERIAGVSGCMRGSGGSCRGGNYCYITSLYSELSDSAQVLTWPRLLGAPGLQAVDHKEADMAMYAER